MLSAGEIEEGLVLGYERRGSEVKGAGLRSDMPLLIKVVRAALGLGNLQDGGHVIIGIDDKKLAQMEPGLNEAELASWQEYDDLATVMKAYSDPPLRFDVAARTLSNGKSVVAIQVFEFTDLPHLCAKDAKDLRKGALYVRPRGMPSTIEVASSVEMREVLDLASAKRLRDFFTTAERAGVNLSGGQDDDVAYAQQRQDAFEPSSDVAVKVQSRGHWQVSIRPERYQHDRLPHVQLGAVLAGAVVRRRGWPVPFIDDRIPTSHGDDWIGQDIAAETVNKYEAWRFFESGQFNHLRVVSAEWREHHDATPVPVGFKSVIEVWEILFYLTEIFELAGRLGLETSKGGSVTLAVQLKLGPATALVGGFPDRVPMDPRPAPVRLSERVVIVPTEKLIGEYGPLAADMVLDIFTRFGWNTTAQQLQILQRELY